MNTTDSVLITCAVVTAGKWAEKKKLDTHVIAGGAFLAVGLAVLDNAQPSLASGLAILIMVSALLRYGGSIVHGLGIA